MSTTALGLIFRPLIVVAFFGAAMWIARSILQRIPEGRVRQLLTREVHWGNPSTEADRQSWFSILVWLAAVLIMWVPLLLFVH